MVITVLFYLIPIAYPVQKEELLSREISPMHGLFATSADNWMCSQNDEDLDKILAYGPVDDVNYFHYGNSKEDLRLSCEGWVMGEKVVNGEFDSPQQLGDYIMDRLK